MSSAENLQLLIVDNKHNNMLMNSLTMYATGSIVGASVSAIVYSSIVASGEITGSLVSSGINVSGSIIGYGTELVAGTVAGNSVRALANVSGSIVKPIISSSSRTFAVGISIIAGAISAIATSALMYGTKEAGIYIYSKVEDYKQHIAEKIQHSEEVDEEVEQFVLEISNFED